MGKWWDAVGSVLFPAALRRPPAVQSSICAPSVATLHSVVPVSASKDIGKPLPARGRCNRRSTLSVCPPSAVVLTRNGNQSQALEEGRAGAVLWANGNQCKASVTEGTWENWVYLARAGGPVRAALPEGYPPVENLEPDGAPFPEILSTLTLRHVFIDRCLRFVRVCHAMSSLGNEERIAKCVSIGAF